MISRTIRLCPVSAVESGLFVQALNAAYDGYFVPIKLSEKSFQDLVMRESVRLDSSRAALDGSHVVGMGLLGVRGDRGWIGGMGVIPACRRRGIARAIMQELIVEARRLGLRSIQLEVIVGNQAACDLYTSLGFKPVRTLLVLLCRSSEMNEPPENINPRVVIHPALPAGLWKDLRSLPGSDLPWQRAPESYADISQDLNGLAARGQYSGTLCGGCIYYDGGSHSSLIDLRATSRSVGRALLASLLQTHPATNFTYLNVDSSDPLLPELEAAGFTETLKQTEMILMLDRG